MKRGQAVAVCHDGKWGRRVKGEVIETRRGHHIKVRFEHCDAGVVEFWCRINRVIRYRKRQGCIVWSARPKYFAGWVDIDWFCPWYVIHPWKETK